MVTCEALLFLKDKKRNKTFITVAKESPCMDKCSSFLLNLTTINMGELFNSTPYTSDDCVLNTFQEANQILSKNVLKLYSYMYIHVLIKWNHHTLLK